MTIQNISDRERQLQSDIEELLQENRLLRARNDRLEREAAQPVSLRYTITLEELEALNGKVPGA